MPNWKTISHSLTEMHNDHGRAAILVSGDNAFTQAVGGDTYIKDITTEKTEGMWEGRDLTPKQIRRWVWDIRKEEVLQDDKTIIWTGYNKEEETSHGGLAQFSEDLDNPFTIKIEVTDG